MGNKVNHLGIIMDGNRRWAKKHKLASVLEGHSRGAYKIIDVCEWCEDVGIEHLTVYAFSTENFKRSQTEVDGIFKLLDEFFVRELDHCLALGVRIKIVGNREMLNPSSRNTAEKAEKATNACNKLTLHIALGYGGRDELLRGVRDFACDVRDGKIDAKNITEELFQSYLDSKDMPDMDMVIRTGGNRRLSNFFPWLTVYSELYFIETLWPDFSRKDFDDALKYFEEIQINVGK